MSENESTSKFKDLLSSESTLKAVFLTSVAGVSALISFSHALTSIKKKDNTKLDSSTAELYKSGSQLAVRALKLGSLYAVTGCGLIIFTIWKLSGAKNKEEFRMKMGSLFPAVPKNNPPQSRTDFTSLTELMRYLDDEFTTKKDTNSNNLSDASNSNS